MRPVRVLLLLGRKKGGKVFVRVGATNVFSRRNLNRHGARRKPLDDVTRACPAGRPAGRSVVIIIIIACPRVISVSRLRNVVLRLGLDVHVHTYYAHTRARARVNMCFLYDRVRTRVCT